ncbi:unnamed protein product [Camellia sinensis]
MVYWRLLFFFSHTLITVTVTVTTAQPNFTFSYCVPNPNNSTTTYEANLKTVISSFSSTINSHGFYSASLGQNSDRVNAIEEMLNSIAVVAVSMILLISSYKFVQTTRRQSHGMIIAGEGARVLAPSCNLQYEMNHFYNDTPVPVPPPPPTQGNNITTIVTIVATSVTITILVVFFTIFLHKRKHKKPTEKIENSVTDEISGVESLQYDFSTIKYATDNFSDSNKLGQGGFGPVYK